MRLIYIIILISLTNTALGQMVISGTVKNNNNEVVEGANVVLQKHKSQAIITYTTTDDKGHFSFKFTKPQTDSISVVVSGISVQTSRRVIKTISQTIDITIKEAILNIREVAVRAEPIRRRGDTLSYVVSQFIDQGDRSIGDVLRKMPGIEIAQTGQIKYHGKPINRFYIENMNVLDGRYGVAMKNVAAKDIATVQVLENHQPIKALQKTLQSDEAAINLKLKESAKGVWTGNIQAGGGYKPGMWNGEVVAMMFARKLQILSTYKGNNEGNDVNSELQRFDEPINNEESIIGIYKPYLPQIKQQYYIQNRTNTVSENMLIKLSKDYELKFNATYLNDRQLFNGESRTSYYLPDKILDIDENTFARYKINRATLDINLSANTDNFYLKNSLKASGQWSVDDGMVTTDGKNVRQWYYRPKADISNMFNLVKKIDKMTLSVTSLNEFNTSPASLNIEPLLYPELVQPGNYTDMNQSLHLTNFLSKTSAKTSFTHGYFTHGYQVGFDADIQWLKSALAPTESVLPDSLSNNLYGSRLKYYITPNLVYKKDNKYSISLSVPIVYQNLSISDFVRSSRNIKNNMLINPDLRISMTVTPSFKINMNSSVNRTIGSLLDSYDGYIMNDYRSISNREGIISDNLSQNHALSLNYGNALYAFFGTLEASYWRNKSNLLYDTKFIGTLSQIKSYAIDNTSQGYTINAKVSKRVGSINTTFTVKASYDKSYRLLLRQSEILNTTNDGLSVGGSFSTLFGKISRLDYDLDWGKYFTKVFGNKYSYAPIETINQKATLMFFPTKALTLKISGEHFYNGSISQGSRSMFFVDASLSYKTKKIEYMLEGRNLSNTKEFYSATYGNAMGYRYVYTLRPAAIMVKVKFYLR